SRATVPSASRHSGCSPAGGRGAIPCGGCAGSRAKRRSRRRCALGAGEAARARPASVGPSPCAPRRRLLPGATGPARRRTVGVRRQPGAKTRARTVQAVAAGCRTRGCGPE
uniref:Uncharacterized protein n=1 Tax=Catagonus wagneri TaxID=51154 RepID=A0A8C3VMZ4_9CETA